MKKITTLLFSFALATQVMYAQTTPPSQLWLNRYNGSGDFSDKFNAVTTDTFNNVYSTGYTFSTNSAEDALTIKLNALGDTIWTRSFNGTGNNTDAGAAIVTDLIGNIYVAGTAKGTATGKDFLIIKYNSIGDTLWTRTYNGTGNGNDDAVSISVDLSGNVFVTGNSDGDLSILINNDFVTIKFDSNGNQLWVVRYNGTGNGVDNPAGLVSDALGNVYVTGRTFNGTNDDISTIKYNPAGVQQWQMIYSGPGIDRPSAIAIDALANIYIAGRSNNGTDDDFITIKYNSSGAQQWLKTYDGNGVDRAIAIAADNSGNVYAAGRSSAGTGLPDDYLTIKYNSIGDTLWTRKYNGTGDGNDVVNAIAIDASGNVVVTGQTDSDPTVVVNNNFTTLKYNAAGTQMWAQSYAGTANKNDSGNDIKIDRLGNIIVTGNIQNLGTQKDGTTIKYSISGTTLWTYNFNGLGDNSDKTNSIFVDAGGFTYATGSTVTPGNGNDYCTIKYNLLGDTLWVKKYNGAGNGSDVANSIAVDASGNVYVTGYSKGLTSKDVTTIKYNSIGDTLWVKKYNGTGNGDDFGIDVKVDASGNVYVTGYSDGDIASTVTNYDYITIKYSPTGSQLWATRYNGVGDAADQPIGIVIDASGNSYVSGKSSSNGIVDDFVTIKYNSTGIQQWNKSYGGAGNDRASAITIDASANIYVTGRTDNGTDDDFATIKYNTAGIQQWVSLYDGLLGNDRAVAIAIEPNGNVYVTGQSSNGTSDNFATLKYNASGAQQWVDNYDGLANGNDVPSSIIVDGAGNILVGGQSDNGTSTLKNYDYTLVKYDNLGTQLWTKSYDGVASSGSDGINSMAIDNSNNIYVTGVSYSLTGQKDVVTIKYDSPVAPLGTTDLAGNADKVSIYPNPFSSSATILIQSSNSANYQNMAFQMYDLLGNEVMRINNIQTNKFTISKGELSNGLYLFKLSQNNGISNSGKINIQ